MLDPHSAVLEPTVSVELLIGAGEPWNTHAKVERTREVESRDREHEWRQTRLLRTGAAPFCCRFHLFMHVLYMSLRLSIPTTTQSLHGAPLSSERPCDMHGRRRRGENQSSRERSWRDPRISPDRPRYLRSEHKRATN